jgi:hypothetical protein
MNKLLLLTALFFGFNSFGQDQTGPDTMALVVHKDVRMEALSRKQAAVNAAARRAAARTMKGYRLLVINTSKRNEAIDAKTKVYTYFPDLKAYLVYQTPYFKLKAGNFKTREEAENYKNSMSAIFPKGVFIVHDTIEVKPEKENNNDL